ncbi:hypothetical protein [Gimesia sp.]|uniref:hypothetical protein n=1 Tax=Gimesia sp. TaxID=2024833 RepID=UPI003A8EC655
MKDVLVKAKKSFYLGKAVKTRRSEPFEVTEHEYKQLSAKGLVDLVTSNTDTTPTSETSEPSSASPADPASPGKTVTAPETDATESVTRSRGKKSSSV